MCGHHLCHFITLFLIKIGSDDARCPSPQVDLAAVPFLPCTEA